ncbi:hypothetical protein D3C81_2140590 [compost metagenome]
MQGGETRQLAGQRATVVRIVEGHVVHRHAALAQRLGEVAHGAEQEGDLLRMVRHMTGLLGHLGEQHAVA